MFRGTPGADVAAVYKTPTESGLNKMAVDSLAASVARQVGYEPGDDLALIVEKLGGTIRIQDVWEIADASSGSIRIDSEDEFEIVLASHTGPTRDRFTIAHEIGHFVLHYLYPKSKGMNVEPIEAKRYGSGRVEWEANWFAAGFLMPKAPFIAAFEEHLGDINTIAEQFKVSVESVKIRVEFLGL